MGRDFAKLEEFLKDKSIALIGNAASLFNEKRDIDSHDVVVRLNKGALLSPDQKEIAGNRTDVIMTSFHHGEEYLAAAPYVVWCPPTHRHKLPPTEAERMYFYPIQWYETISKKIGHRLSTGCMAMDICLRFIGTGSVTLYGFDFWKSETWYEGINRPGPHSPGAEEAYFEEMRKSFNLSIVR